MCESVSVGERGASEREWCETECVGARACAFVSACAHASSEGGRAKEREGDCMQANRQDRSGLTSLHTQTIKTKESIVETKERSVTEGAK